ncbi:MAG: hypothetical protein HQL88_09385 [Magnetococcales bacterium]|nr:hypothetical protein [Magnetococcales bacterium]
MLDWLLHLLNHPWIPWIGSGTIMTWGTLQWLHWQRHSVRPIQERLAEDLLRLQQGFPPTHATQGHGAGNAAAAIPTLPILREQLEKDWEQHHLHAIPTRFLGMGLLFTLLGLTAALVFMNRALHAEQIASARQALDGLLLAASFKFLSSISGLCTAFLYAWAVKWQRNRLAEQARMLCQHWEPLYQEVPTADWPTTVQTLTQVALSQETLEEDDTPPIPVQRQADETDDTALPPSEVSPYAPAAVTQPPAPPPTSSPVLLQPLLPVALQKTMDKPVKTLDTGGEEGDAAAGIGPDPQQPVMATDRAAAIARIEKQGPTVTAPPRAQQAQGARGPVFAQLAGEFFNTRQGRRRTPPAKAVLKRQ